MRKKERKLVVTFHTTADAMAMEKTCREFRVPGRLIPVPRVISAGCGLAGFAGFTLRRCSDSIEYSMTAALISRRL